jgi:uncharacterized protein (TIGR02231 family)
MPALETALTTVTVYPDRARLTRAGSLALDPGLHTLEIAGLPLQLNPDSVRAAARGTARVRLLGVQVNTVFFTDTPAEQVRELEAQIEAAQDELAGNEARAGLLKSQRANLEALAGKVDIYATALAAGERSVEAHLAFMNGLREAIERLDGEARAVAAARRELERRLKKLQNELNALRGARPRQRYTAQVEVEVLQGGELAVELSYLVSGAGWQPLYDLRLAPEAGLQHSLELSYLAQVIQGTGEAWEDVSLALSTARPALAGRLPELDPWYVGPLPPLPKPHRLADAAPAPALMKAARGAEMAYPAAEGEAFEAVEAEVLPAEVESSGASVTYQVPGRVTIPADGAPHKVTVARLSLPPVLDYMTAPRLVAAVYRRAKVRNDSPYTFLPGPASLFAGEEFIGTTGLEFTAPQGEIELYLGVDDRVKVERELKRREVDKRLIGGKRRTVFGYEITLENLLDTVAHVTVQDQFPVARHEEIKVRLESAEPRPTRQSELNILDWDFNLAPREKRAVRFDFSVEHPQGMEVVGLA